MFAGLRAASSCYVPSMSTIPPETRPQQGMDSAPDLPSEETYPTNDTWILNL